ncbi:hypothetical protein BDV30DRAFT_209654 [Aspergillus minisclerotigenes]|uniref:Uncharacterized protein n=1 Tax=Aspergillus minisclerotigenes TaxID=656917 RepID=A0A5N6J561_9EURO|nr:hypothetical protein BDV30DRAFT_209654 [Aspergillus minisclerotigenes]
MGAQASKNVYYPPLLPREPNSIEKTPPNSASRGVTMNFPWRPLANKISRIHH